MFQKFTHLSVSALFLVATVCVIGAPADPANAAPNRRFSIDDNGNFLIFGNSVGFDCRPATPQPTVGIVPPLLGCGLNINDAGSDVFWRSDFPVSGQAIASLTNTSLFARSTANLNLPAGARVLYARLYWASLRTLGAGPDPSVRLERPGVYIRTVNSEPTNGSSFVNANPVTYYQSSADVTKDLQTYGAGIYRVSGIAANDLNNLISENSFVAWNIIVFYRDPNEPTRNLALFDGLDLISKSNQTLPISGFLVPTVGADARLGVLAYGGDFLATGDSLRVNGTTLSNAANPADNFFNSTRSVLGNYISVAGDLPQLSGQPGSTSGYDADVVDITPLVKGGDKQAQIEAVSTNDDFLLGAFMTAISTVKPVFTNTTKTYVNSSRFDGRVLPGDMIQYTISTVNTGSDTGINVTLTDMLPAGVTYVPNSLEITAGPNSGSKTDTAGDDQGNYTANTRTVVFRLGTGANGAQGGSLAPGQSSTVRFLVQVDQTATGVISNQAVITAQGQTAVTQGVTDVGAWTSGNGTDLNVTTDFMISTCQTNADCPVNAPICDTLATPPVCICRTNGDCPSSQVCNVTTQTCVECALGQTQNCNPDTVGGVCLPNNTCGCLKNSDCSGRTCDTGMNVCPAAPLDLVVSLMRQPAGSNVLPGTKLTYMVAVTNNGPGPVNGASLSNLFSSEFSNVTWTCSGANGGQCPAPTGSGSISTLLTLPANGQLIYTVSASVPDAQMSQSLEYNVSVAPPRGYADPQPGNNSASDSVIVTPLGPDLSVTITEERLPGERAINYMVQVHNAGPGVAAGATVTYEIPAGATITGIDAGAGWVCQTQGNLVTCIRTEPIPVGDAAPIKITVLPPQSAETIPVRASVEGKDSEGGPLIDPNPADNTIDRSSEVGRFGLRGGGLAYGCGIAAMAHPDGASNGTAFAAAVLALLLLGMHRTSRRAFRQGDRQAL